MAWVEKHRNSYLVRDWVNGKKKTLRTFSSADDAEREARYFAKNRELRPFTAGEFLYRLEQRSGSTKRKRTPKLSAYAYETIESDANIGEDSRDAYISTIRNHVQGSIIDVALADIEPATLRKFYTGLTPTKNYAAGGDGMRSSVLRVLNKVLRVAVIDGVIPNNPMERANIKRPSKKRAVEIEPLTIDQIEALAAATTNERDRLMILVGGYCGLRGGEVGGLQVKDVDTQTCEFHIRKAVKGSGSKKTIGLPKGNKTRKIVVPCSLANEVAEFARKNAADDGRIFHADGMIGARKTNDVSQAAAKRVGNGPVNFHALRHSCASLLIADGATILDVCAYLGHSSPTITLDIYGHLFHDSGKKLADSMEARRTEWRERVKKLAV